MHDEQTTNVSEQAPVLDRDCLHDASEWPGPCDDCGPDWRCAACEAWQERDARRDACRERQESDSPLTKRDGEALLRAIHKAERDSLDRDWRLLKVVIVAFVSLLATLVLLVLARPAHAQERADPIATAREARDWGAVARLADERIALQAAAARPLFTDRPAGRATLDHRGNGTAEASVLVQRWAAILAGETFRRWDHDTGHVGVELALPLTWVAHRSTGAEAHTLQLRARLTLGSSFRQGSTLTGESAVGFGFASGSWQAGGQFFAWLGKRHNGDWFASLGFEHRDGWGSDDDPFGWRAGVSLETRFGRDFKADLSRNAQHTVLLRGAVEWRPAPQVCLVVGLAFAPVRAAASQANARGDYAGLVWEGLTAFVGVEYRGNP